MITAKQAQNIVKKIDWSKAILTDIERSITNLASAGYTQYRYRFSENIPDEDKQKIVIKLQKLGFNVTNPFITENNWYDISWR